ncbi:p-aminobenzoic acid synthase [Cardiosporidium cionae]|uniref:aminodeoxychorismate synthase n=1 Tax=Cardiosporidium cionae TaxID=476202 RepID=A0ABQ7JD32_9APIC|nr:p-aminobenzoic acid synthase [Cardiosporidium cionae]|eukprot:KAF8821853.1 p-aminobenzoic acid synthase [Cardiosporidium cionae]
MKKEKARMQTLLIDNYDSYTYNLYQYLATINDSHPIVIFNDSFKKWKDVESAYPNISNVVISPGPGSPEKPGDFGVCLDCILTASVPILGVCLGHQGISFAYGGQNGGILCSTAYVSLLNGANLAVARFITACIECREVVVNAPEVMHGRTSNVCFSHECELFDGISQNTIVMRYHSLLVPRKTTCIASLRSLCLITFSCQFSLPACLKISCWTNDSYQHIMGLQHESRPLYGVQFHPESICTVEGYKLLQNFKRITESWWMHANPTPLRELPIHLPLDVIPSQQANVSPTISSSHEAVEELQLMEVNIVKVCFRSSIEEYLQEHTLLKNTQKDTLYGEPMDMESIPVDSATLFSSLFREYPISFWLDSSSHNNALLADTRYDERRGRFSYLGNAYGPLSEIITYYGKNRLRRCHPRCASSLRDLKIHKSNDSHAKAYDTYDGGFSANIEESIDIFDWLKKYLSWFSVELPEARSSSSSSSKQFSRLRFCEWTASVTAAFESNTTLKSSTSHPTVGGIVSSPILISKDSTHCNAPFDFVGGFTGFFGYETGEDTAAKRTIRKVQPEGTSKAEFMNNVQPPHRNDKESVLPMETLDSLWIFADRLIVYDHKQQEVFLVWLAPLDHRYALAEPENLAASVDGNSVDCSPPKVAESLLTKCITGQLIDEDIRYIRSQQQIWVESILDLFAKEIKSSSPLHFLNSLRNPPLNNALNGPVLGCSNSLLQLNSDAAEELRDGLTRTPLYSQKCKPGLDTQRISKENTGKNTCEGKEYVNGESKSAPEICGDASKVDKNCNTGMRKGVAEHQNLLHVSSTLTTHEKNCLIFRPNHSRRVYMDSIKEILQLIRNGETYEVCLTNQLRADLNAQEALDPHQFYHILRKKNAAPFGAFLYYDTRQHVLSSSTSNENTCSTQFQSHPDSSTDDNAKADTPFRKSSCDINAQPSTFFALCCSSPERFLKIDQNGMIESKPMKGTIARGKSVAEDESNAETLRLDIKERAENLMIVDLVRNDLGRVCKPGSVVVPGLLQIESFPTVHQLVSTIRGTLASSEFDAIDAVVTSFPGGSMTGAPKHRTQSILRRLEEQRRGAYSGSLGFLSINGSLDLNIVIRTACWTENKISVGAGGAIVALSDTEKEYEEMLLKANATINALRSYSDMLHPKVDIVIQLDETA